MAVKSRTIRAVAYLRRSTKAQEASIADQRQAVKEYADKHGYLIVHWYIDDGISGDSTEKRLDFLQMREDATLGDFAFVLCWDQERFGRFDSLEAGHWIYPFRKAKVQLVTVNEGVTDWEDFTGRMMYSMKQEGKHQYLRDLSRNVLRGQIEAAKKGSWCGTAPYAYRIEGERKQKRLVLDEHRKVTIVERIFREFVEDGRSMSNIADRLNAEAIKCPGFDNKPKKGKEQIKKVWRFDAVKWILQNPAYIGTFRWNTYSQAKYHHFSKGESVKSSKRGRNDEADWIVFENHHEAIIDRRTFNKAQAILAKAKTGRSPHKPEDNPYLLTGLLRCSRCGSVLHGIENRKYRYYECSRKKHYRDCDGTTVREDVVLDRLAEFIEQEFVSYEDQTVLRRKARSGRLTKADLPAAFDKLKKLLVGNCKQRSDPTRIEHQLAQIEAKQAKVKRNLAYVDPQYIATLQGELNDLDEQRTDLKRKLRQQPSESDINELVLDVLRKLCVLAKQERDDLKPVLRELDSITCHTKLRGVGNGKRHEFKRGEIRFKQVSGVTGDSNPHLPG